MFLVRAGPFRHPDPERKGDAVMGLYDSVGERGGKHNPTLGQIKIGLEADSVISQIYYPNNVKAQLA